MDELLRCMAEFLIAVPAAVLCYLPMLGLLRISRPKIIAGTSAVLAALVVGGGLLCQRYSLSTNAVLLPALPLLFFCYWQSVKADWRKCLFVFLTGAYLCSFPWMTATCVDLRQPSFPGQHWTWGAIFVQLLTAAALLAIFWHPASVNLRRSVENPGGRLWNLLWLLPGTFLLFSLYLTPWDAHLLLVGRALEIYVVLYVALMALLCFLYLLLYRMARDEEDRSRLEQANQLLRMEAERYSSLRRYLDHTRVARHDFRHQLLVIRSYAEKGDLEALRHYLGGYESTLVPEQPPLCANAAADSIAGHYRDRALQAGARVACELSLPETLPLPEADFCMALGNLMENAAEACERQTSGKKFVDVRAGLHSASILLLAVENSYDGELRPSGELFLSQKTGGEGIGLRSVRTCAEKYRGRMKVEAKDGVFRVSVLFNL